MKMEKVEYSEARISGPIYSIESNDMAKDNYGNQSSLKFYWKFLAQLHLLSFAHLLSFLLFPSLFFHFFFSFSTAT